MAKKQSKKQATEIATLEQFTIGGNLDVSDVLSVVTSKAEERYSAEIDKCRQEVAELQATCKKLRSDATKQAKKEALGAAEKHVDALKAAVKSLDGTVSSEMLGGAYNNAVIPLNKDGELGVCIRVGSQSSSYNCRADFTVTVKPTKSLLKLVDEVAVNEEKITALNNEAVSWKRKLNNIPMLERRYRARIAAAKLETSGDGKKLLAMLTDDLEESILALPSC